MDLSKATGAFLFIMHFTSPRATQILQVNASRMQRQTSSDQLTRPRVYYFCKKGHHKKVFQSGTFQSVLQSDLKESWLQCFVFCFVHGLFTCEDFVFVLNIVRDIFINVETQLAGQNFKNNNNKIHQNHQVKLKDFSYHHRLVQFGCIHILSAVDIFVCCDKLYLFKKSMATINAVSNVNLFTKSMVTKIAAVHVAPEYINKICCYDKCRS